MEINQITQKYRKNLNLSLRQFAQAINKSLINTDVSHSKVLRWESGRYEPELNLLFECIATYPKTWVAQWAVENICAMYPDLVQSGVIVFNLPAAQ